MLRIQFLRTTRAQTPVGLAMKCIMEYEASSIPTMYCKLRTSTIGSDSIYTPCWGKAEPRSCTMVSSLSTQPHPRSSDLPSTTGLPTSGSFSPSLRTISHGRIEKCVQKSAWRKLSRRLLQVAAIQSPRSQPRVARPRRTTGWLPSTAVPRKISG